MSLKKIKFGDKEVDKKEFCSSKQAISLDSVDLDKIFISNKWKMYGYIKYFDDGGKNMTFATDNEKVYDKYNEIWEVIRKICCKSCSR